MSNLEFEAENKLRACLESIPFVSIQEIKREIKNSAARIDLVVRLEVNQNILELLVDIKKKGEPRLIRDAVNQLLRTLNGQPNAYGIVVAPFISAASAAICKEANVGYIDLSGNCFLSFQNIHIEKEGKANQFVEIRTLRSIFYPKAERILRILLNQPGKFWKMQLLAETAAVSLGQVAKVKKQLQEWAFIEASNEGFYLKEWRELLENWRHYYSYRKNKIYDFYSFDDMAQFENKLNLYCREADIRYALTLFSGADKIAPFTRINRFFAYVEKSIPDIQEALKLKPVASGATVTLLTPYDAGVFYNADDKIKNIVSPIQLYLDLNSFGGRGEDAADFILAQKIEKIWSQN